MQIFSEIFAVYNWPGFSGARLLWPYSPNLGPSIEESELKTLVGRICRSPEAEQSSATSKKFVCDWPVVVAFATREGQRFGCPRCALEREFANG